MFTHANVVPVPTDSRPRLDQAALQAAAGSPWSVRLYDAADSTNALAASAPERDLVVVADHQQAGRGRLDRTWVTPPGAALTFSAVVDPRVDAPWWSLVPLVAGYAVARAVHGTVKWPNDVLVEDHKLCGILVERVQSPAAGTPLAVIGIGINVSQTRAELPVESATSLALTGLDTDRTVLFGDVLHQLRTWLDILAQSPQAFVGHYRAQCSTVGQSVRIELPGERDLLGEAAGIDEYGRLLVETEKGPVPVAAGDVVHVRPRE